MEDAGPVIADPRDCQVMLYGSGVVVVEGGVAVGVVAPFLPQEHKIGTVNNRETSIILHNELLFILKVYQT